MDNREIEFIGWVVREGAGKKKNRCLASKILLRLTNPLLWMRSAKSFGRWLAVQREPLKVQLAEYGVEMDWQEKGRKEAGNRVYYSFEQTASGGSLGLADLERTAQEMEEVRIEREKAERVATERERLDRLERIAAWARTVVAVKYGEGKREYFSPTEILRGTLGRQVSRSEGSLFSRWLKENEHYYTVQDRLAEDGIWFSRNSVGDTNSYSYRVHL